MQSGSLVRDRQPGLGPTDWCWAKTNKAVAVDGPGVDVELNHVQDEERQGEHHGRPGAGAVAAADKRGGR